MQGHPLRRTLTMIDRKDAKRRYRETPPQRGIVAIRNLVSGRVFLGSASDLHGKLDRERFVLRLGGHPNRALQEDWNRLGPDAFAFEVLELLAVPDDPGWDAEEALRVLERSWLDRFRPLDVRCYNENEHLRLAG